MPPPQAEGSWSASQIAAIRASVCFCKNTRDVADEITTTSQIEITTMLTHLRRLKIPHEFWLLHEHGAAVTSNQLLRLQQFVQVCLCECTCTRRRRPFASGSGHGCADMNMISFEPFFDCSNSCRSLLFTWRAHHD
jgi:hypothetical protein